MRRAAIGLMGGLAGAIAVVSLACTTIVGTLSDGVLLLDATSSDGSSNGQEAGDTLVADAGVDTAVPSPDADMSDAGPCVPGAACAPAACQTGLVACTDAGRAVCQAAGDVLNGMACDAGAVCNQGVCAGCANGADCTDAGSCQKKIVDCSSGAAVCAAAGNEADGTMCGTNLYCNGGTCAPCSNGAGCVPTGKPCDRGTVTCSGGQIVCTDVGPNTDGTSCGTNMVCVGGACSSCTANASCTPPNNPCNVGRTSCSSGASACTDTGTANTALNGTSCGTNQVCDNGTCNPCSAGTACTLSAPANVCDNGQTVCGSGAAVCTDTGTANAALNGTTCAAGKVCDNGGCNACVTGAACVPTNPCHAGTTVCSSGSPVCMDTGGNAVDGTSCGAPLACYQGICQCDFAGLAAYYPFNGDANDHSGNNNNATGTGTVFVTGGTFGKAIHMSGTGSTITISGSTVLSGARTVCAFVDTTGLTSGAGQPVVSFGSLGAADFLGFQPANSPSTCSGVLKSQLFVEHTSGAVGGPCGPAPSVAVTTAGGYNFVCYAYDGSTMTLYSNGLTATYATALYNWPMSSVTIASNTTSDSSVQAVKVGEIDELSFWSRALSMTEMNALYNSGNGCKVH